MDKDSAIHTEVAPAFSVFNLMLIGQLVDDKRLTCRAGMNIPRGDVEQIGVLKIDLIRFLQFLYGTEVSEEQIEQFGTAEVINFQLMDNG